MKNMKQILDTVLAKLHKDTKRPFLIAIDGMCGSGKTTLADYLAKKNVPFRTAYKIVGTIVGECIEKGIVLDEMSLEDYRKHCADFDNDLYEEISLESCVSKRISSGGTGAASVDAQIAFLESVTK